MSTDACIILGGGGHAKVLVDAMRLQDRYVPVGLLDKDSSRAGSDVLGIEVIGQDDLLPSIAGAGTATHFIVGVGSLGDSSSRQRLFQAGLDAGLKPATVIHPSAVVSPSADIGPGSMVFAGAVINPGSKVGENVIINTRCVIEHDCSIGNHVHAAPGSIVCGHVSIGEGVHIGAGAVIREGLTIGNRVLAAAGAVVVSSLPDDVTAKGVPARWTAS